MKKNNTTLDLNKLLTEFNAEKDNIENKQIKTKMFLISDHKIVEINTPKIIKIPPNVGVPAFLNICEVGPSLRIG